MRRIITDFPHQISKSMKILIIGNTLLECRVQKYKKSKRLAISVAEDGKVRMSIPYWCTYRQAKKFLDKKQDWIVQHVEKTKNRGAQSMLSLGTYDDYLENRETARSFVRQRVEHFNSFYLFDYKKISIKNQKSRWGSCSGMGNLNFNYRIIYLKSEHSDYLIVHELCHLKHLDHSQEFWKCVGQAIPQFRQLRKELRNL